MASAVAKHLGCGVLVDMGGHSVDMVWTVRAHFVCILCALCLHFVAMSWAYVRICVGILSAVCGHGWRVLRIFAHCVGVSVGVYAGYAFALFVFHAFPYVSGSDCRV